MKTIFEKSIQGRHSFTFRDQDFGNSPLDDLENVLRKKEPILPEISEIDLLRHYTALSTRNKGIDNIFYPLGSCTMKYNPRLHEEIVAWPDFSELHPHNPEAISQGNLQIIYETEEMLSKISGMDAFTMQPAAGAHGEFTGIVIMKAFHKENGENEKRRKILIPDAAHGTNPASATLCGYDVVTIPSDARGGVAVDYLKKHLDDTLAGFLMTNPNTLGVFDENILEISSLVHKAGGLLYYDGANFNAILGKCKPGDMGFDIIHINLHKTFSTPHGGGGPGAGPVGVKERLKKYLPIPRIYKDQEGFYSLQRDRKDTIGPLITFHGNFLVVLRAYVYMKLLGADGLKDVSESAVLNANYMMHHLKEEFDLPYDRICMHEFVLSSSKQQKYGVYTKNIAKRLIDKGYHPPTTYFPLIVDEALMVEPTETENKETLDQFISDMKDIAQECRENPEHVKLAPHTTPVRHLDEVAAARKPKLRWYPQD